MQRGRASQASSALVEAEPLAAWYRHPSTLPRPRALRVLAARGDVAALLFAGDCCLGHRARHAYNTAREILRLDRPHNAPTKTSCRVVKYLSLLLSILRGDMII